jgi:hypothetical protein
MWFEGLVLILLVWFGRSLGHPQSDAFPYRFSVNNALVVSSMSTRERPEIE